MVQEWWKMKENAGLGGSRGVWEPLEGAWGASWSQDGAQERQEELQEGRWWPTWRQDGPTWLENGVPNPSKID